MFLFIQGNKHPVEKPDYNTPADSVFNNPSFKEIFTNVNLPAEAFKYAYSGFKKLTEEELLTNDSLLTIVDYSKPSFEERFFVIDLKNKKLICKSLVAHGRNTGEIFAESFSNSTQSHKSSLGLFVASDTYNGRHGYSLHLDGMEKGLNDNARQRAIVIHGANYVSESFIEQNGRIGRSFGCPALPNDISEEVINLIKGGSCLYIYHPQISSILRGDQ